MPLPTVDVHICFTKTCCWYSLPSKWIDVLCSAVTPYEWTDAYCTNPKQQTSDLAVPCACKNKTSILAHHAISPTSWSVSMGQSSHPSPQWKRDKLHHWTGPYATVHSNQHDRMGVSNSSCQQMYTAAGSYGLCSCALCTKCKLQSSCPRHAYEGKQTCQAPMPGSESPGWHATAQETRQHPGPALASQRAYNCSSRILKQLKDPQAAVVSSMIPATP